jgi:dTDP-4-amino-4,6-dideoxygalactose transaminase
MKQQIIPYGNHYIDKDDIKSIISSIKKDKITTGPEVNIFEKNLANYTKSKYVSVCNSGTSAIHLSLLSINIKKNDIIIMPSINFVASYNISSFLGAKIYLADVNSKTGQMEPEHVFDCIKKYRIKKIKAIIVMYNGGYPENASKFIKFKKKYNCYLIEDACHALGASYKTKKINYKIGSCKHADLSTFSLHPLKSITTGEGGVVTTNSKIFDKKIKFFRSHGILRKNKSKHWDYDVINLGFNFRLTDFQCALGNSQLKKINLFINYRKKIFNLYHKLLKDFEYIELPNYSKNINSSFHLLIINIKNFSVLKKEKLIRYMLKKGIILQYHYKPIYLFKNFNGKISSKINSLKYYNSCVSLPIYFGLTEKKVRYIIRNLKAFFLNNQCK